MNSKQVIEHLNQVLIDTYSLYLKTQLCHWNVHGENFYSLHLLFEEHYKDLASAVDEIAERITALGEKVKINFININEDKHVSDSNSTQRSSQEMLKDLVKSHKIVMEQLDILADISSKNNDKVTEDLAIGRLKTHASQSWMLSSSILQSSVKK